jgi:fructokinase
MERVLVAGETLVDLFPVGPGGLAECDGFQHRPGGAPANVTVGLARLGTRTTFWTRLCGDAFGDYLGDALEREGVADRLVRRIPGANTTLAVVTPSADANDADDADTDADPEFAFYGDSAGTFGFETGVVTDSKLAETCWIHVGGVALTHPDGARAMVDLVERAQAADCTVSFDPNFRPDRLTDVDRTREDVQRVLAHCDVVCSSRAECAWLDGVDATGADEGARALLDQGPHTAFVTDGADGAAVHASEAAPWGSTSASHAGFEVDTVDPTGAGDAFTAAVTHRLAEEPATGDLESVLTFASAAGACAVQDRGAMAGLPTAEGVEAVLESR